MCVENYIEQLLESIESVDLNDFCVECGLVGARGFPTNDDRIEGLVRFIKEATTKSGAYLKFKNDVFSFYTGSYWKALPSNDNNMEFIRILKSLATKLGYSSNIKHLKALSSQIKLEFYEESSNKSLPMINLKNGTLVLKEDGIELKEFDSKDNLTYQMDFEYMEDAPENEIFKQYLDRVLKDKNTQRTLQEALGYLFVTNLKLEKMFILYGKGNNGKSVIFEIISSLLGKENISNASLTQLLSERFSLPLIENKLVNYCSDIDFRRFTSGIGVLKQIISQEPIAVKKCGKDFYEISNYAKLIFNANALDGLRSENTHGFHRRFVIIPFNVEIPEEEVDPDLHKKILENKSAILNWILVGARAVLESRDIYISEECLMIKNDALKKIDSVKLFVQNHAEDFKNLTVNPVLEEYESFCKKNMYQPCSRKDFEYGIKQFGYYKDRTDKGMQFLYPVGKKTT
jgi:putative DNA primase/helicase